MKKKVLALMFAVVATLSLTACGKTGTCESCGKEDVKIKKLEYQGESAWLCSDCYDAAEAVIKLAEAFNAAN